MNKMKGKVELSNEDGFSLLELVVAIGIILVLTVGGLIGYNAIKNNAVKASVEKAASDVMTAAVVEMANGVSSVEEIEVIGDKWNESASNDSIVADVKVGSGSEGACITVKATHKNGEFAEKSNCKTEEESNNSGSDGSDSTGSDNTGSDGTENEEINNPRSMTIHGYTDDWYMYTSDYNFDATYEIKNSNGEVVHTGVINIEISFDGYEISDINIRNGRNVLFNDETNEEDYTITFNFNNAPSGVSSSYTANIKMPVGEDAPYLFLGRNKALQTDDYKQW